MIPGSEIFPIYVEHTLQPAQPYIDVTDPSQFRILLDVILSTKYGDPRHLEPLLRMCMLGERYRLEFESSGSGFYIYPEQGEGARLRAFQRKEGYPLELTADIDKRGYRHNPLIGVDFAMAVMNCALQLFPSDVVDISTSMKFPLVAEILETTRNLKNVLSLLEQEESRSSSRNDGQRHLLHLLISKVSPSLATRIDPTPVQKYAMKLLEASKPIFENPFIQLLTCYEYMVDPTQDTLNGPNGKIRFRRPRVSPEEVSIVNPDE